MPQALIALSDSSWNKYGAKPGPRMQYCVKRFLPLPYHLERAATHIWSDYLDRKFCDGLAGQYSWCSQEIQDSGD